MPDIAAANVTVTVLDAKRGGPGCKRNLVRIQFGDGALTYPSGGVPLPAKTAFGLPFALTALVLLDQEDGDGLIYKFDHINQKIRIWFPTQQTGGTGNRAGVELTGGSSAPAATTLYAEAVGF